MSGSQKLTRRRFLSAVASTTASSCLPLAGAAILASELTETCAAQFATRIRASGEATVPPPVMIDNAGYSLLIDPVKGTIASLRSTYGVDRELLIPNHAGLPLFKIELMNDHSEFKTVNSSQAREIALHRREAEKEEVITIEFTGIESCLSMRGLLSGVLTKSHSHIGTWN